jgi:type I restriction enzyme R subunit
LNKETDARIVIDGLLRQAGWDPADKSQVLTTRITPDREFADYVPLSSNERPLAVVEAKRERIDPYTGKH